MVERTIISRPVLLHPWQFFEDLETFIPKIASIYLFWMSNLGFTTEKTKNLSTQHVNLRCPNCLVNLKVTSCLSLNGVFMPGRGTDGLHLFQKNNLRESNKTLVFFKSKNAISWWQLAVRVCVYNIYIYIYCITIIHIWYVGYIHSMNPFAKWHGAHHLRIESVVALNEARGKIHQLMRPTWRMYSSPLKKPLKKKVWNGNKHKPKTHVSNSLHVVFCWSYFQKMFFEKKKAHP